MPDLVPRETFDTLPERYQRRAKEIANRVREIDAIIVPCDPSTLRYVVDDMLGHLRPQPDTDAATLASGFKKHCADLPEWALSEAANDFLGGRVENHTGQFMPTCAEFAKRARDILVPFHAERASLRVEAGKLVERARDEAHRAQLEIERADPKVRERVREMVGQVSRGDGPLKLTSGPLDEAKRAELDRYRKSHERPSKLAETPIVKSSQQKRQA